MDFLSGKNRKLVACLLAVLVVCLVQFFFGSILDYGLVDDIRYPNREWNMTLHGKQFTFSPESQYFLPEPLVRGDTVVLENYIDGETSTQSVVRFRSYHSVVDVLQNDQVIYSYGHRFYDQGVMVGSGYHFVHTKGCEGECKITVRLIAGEDKAFREISLFEILPIASAHSDYYARHFFSLVVGIFLILFGIISFLISVCLFFKESSPLRFVMIGFLSFSLGLWTLCYSKLLQIFSTNFSYNTSLEYVMLFFSPIPFGILLLLMSRGKVAQWKWRCLLALVIAGVIVFLSTGVLNFLDILHFPRTLVFFHIYAGICSVFLIASGFLYNKHMDSSQKILSIGFVSYVFFSVIDLVRFNLNNAFPVNDLIGESSFVPLGTLCFVLFLVGSYLAHLFRIVSDKAEKDILATMAYVDALTGLYNRAKCQQVFDKLDQEMSDYAIISVDMNGLKLVNDRHGHLAGDALIKAYAVVFKQAFFGIGTAIRMGGDEFLAIVRKEHLTEVDGTMEKLVSLQKKCKADIPIPLEAAYGVAYHHECGADAPAEAVYHLADEKMYTMKAQMKSALSRD